MTTLLKAHHEWASRRPDERFTDLVSMHEAALRYQTECVEIPVMTRRLQVQPQEDNKGLILVGGQKKEAAPTHWAFGQLCVATETPAGFFRTIPSPYVADIINYKLQAMPNKEMGLLLHQNGGFAANALTGPKYGRVWNEQVIAEVIKRFGTGKAGNGSPWQVPGEFGHRVNVTKDNTTLFCGESDMFIFLVDEENKIEVPGRGPMARGFFVWNSEVGKCVLGIATFFFDYVCCNRIVWGATQYKQIKIRHTAGAPVRWEDEVMPALEAYHKDSSKTIVAAIEAARRNKFDDDEKLNEFIAQRFGKRMAPLFQDVHLDEEQRPIESMWDVVTAATAYARSIKWQDERVDVERKAGDILELARKAA